MEPLAANKSSININKINKSCTKCDYSSSSKIYLKQHRAYKHTEMLYKCDKCDVTSSTSSYLRNHIMKIHLNIKRTIIRHAKVKARQRRNCTDTVVFKTKNSKSKICLCGGANLIKRTNSQTLEWLKFKIWYKSKKSF